MWGVKPPVWPARHGATLTTDQANVNGTEGYGGTEPPMVWRKRTTLTGQFPANAFGLYDLHGNILDWCEDVWNKTYNGAPADGSPWLTGDASVRVRRGGAWYGPPVWCRSASRVPGSSSDRSTTNGFRLARTLSPPAP